MSLTFGSLFAGIGGFDLGLERAGMIPKWQVEINPFCRQVLAKHWPNVARYEDVKEVGASTLEPVNLICGGFPCQDISAAGKGAGLTGSRSGLWFEFARILKELQPAYALIENVPPLRSRGLGRILKDLREIGYDAEWHCIPASAIGAPHQRDRIWIVAYTASEPQPESRYETETVCNCRNTRLELGRSSSRQQQSVATSPLAHPHQPRLEGWHRQILQQCPSEWIARSSNPLGDSKSLLCDGGTIHRAGDTESTGALSKSGNASAANARSHPWWRTEPDVGRVAHGIPRRVDRLTALGGAVIPQLVEYIGSQILEFHNARP